MQAILVHERSDTGSDKIPYIPEWSAEAAFGEDAVIAGFNASVEPIIGQALKMIGLPDKKIQISTHNSLEPASVNYQSPVTGFKGYPR